MPAFLTHINEAAKSKVLTVQEYFGLAAKALRFIFARPFYMQDVVQQMDEIGVKSLGIVMLTGLFTGMVLALQSSVQLKTFGATMYIGNLVSASMIRELGPVLAGLMVAGRVGSGIAAQLGSMRVTEQIDALNTLGTDPIKKLVTPRVIAALIMLPVLTIINDFIGIIGGNIIASFVVGLPTTQYWRTVWDQMASDGFTLRYIPNDFMQGLIKPFVFGGLIAITACYFGLGTTGGTEGVGQSTTKTVVSAEHPDLDRRLLHHPAPVVRAVLWMSTRRMTIGRPPCGDAIRSELATDERPTNADGSPRPAKIPRPCVVELDGVSLAFDQPDTRGGVIQGGRSRNGGHRRRVGDRQIDGSQTAASASRAGPRARPHRRSGHHVV